MLVFAVTMALSFCITPLIIFLYKRFNWLDDPKSKHHAKNIHLKPIPRGGGLVIFFSVLIISLFFLQIDKYLVGILIAAALLTLTGFIDDIFDIHPIIRLIVGFLAAAIVVGSGIGIAYVTNPFSSGVIHLNQPQIPLFLFGKTRTIWILADLFALFFIVWNMNIVNWSKGVAGQLPGFTTIALIFIGLISLKFIDDPTQFNTSHLSFIVAGSYAGFLIWNFYPQKIMPGYGAGSLAGFFMATLAILSGAKIAASLMVLGIPTADAIFTIIRRIMAGKSPFWGDRGHFHHKLFDILGWTPAKITIFYMITTLLLGILALYLNTLGKIVTMTVVIILVFGFLIWAKFKALHES